jgi:putative ABC transport system ATP-binding protein
MNGISKTVPEQDRVSLRAVGLTRSFGRGATQTVAVRDVSLDLLGGSMTVVIGPSGCGKSTLLALLAGLLRPDAGRVLVLGEDLWQKTDGQRRDFRLRHFGFIFQAHNLFPTLTAREQLELVVRWGEELSARRTRRRVAEMLDLLGLAHKADLLPAELSGGEKQRVAVGRALLKDPGFCFADEPTSALDWQHGRQVIELLKDATSNRGATVLIATHDPRIAPYADRVVPLDDGRLVEPDGQNTPGASEKTGDRP